MDPMLERSTDTLSVLGASKLAPNGSGTAEKNAARAMLHRLCSILLHLVFSLADVLLLCTKLLECGGGPWRAFAIEHRRYKYRIEMQKANIEFI